MPLDIVSRPNPLVPVRTLKNPVTFQSDAFEFPEGMTIAEMVDISIPQRSLHKYLVATISGNMIPFENWHLVKPKSNSFVIFRLIPEGGDGNKILRTVLLIAVVAASITLAVL